MTAPRSAGDALRALGEGATAGPWRGPNLPMMAREHGEGSSVSGPLSQGIVDAVGYVGQDCAADLSLIVALRNALPALARVLDAADALRSDWPLGALHTKAANYDSALRDLLSALEGDGHGA